MIKRKISVIIPFVLAMLFALPLSANELYVNGSAIDCYSENGITYAPVREFMEQYEGYKVSWDRNEKAAVIKGNGLDARVPQDKEYTLANGRVLVRNGINRNKKGRIYAPVTLLAEAVDGQVSWNGKTKTATVNGGGGAIKNADSYYNSEDLYWLSRIISAESRGEPFMGKCAVGNVVLNRKASAQFPSTVKGVIFDTKYGVQFSPISDGSVYAEPTYESVLAAKAVLDGFVRAEGMLYFLNPRTAQSSWIVNNRPFGFSLGNHDFYY